MLNGIIIIIGYYTFFHGVDYMNFKKLEMFLEDIEKEGCPFFGLKIVYKGEEVYKKICGLREDKSPAGYDDVFFLYSCTKVVTAVAAMQMVEKGKFCLDDPVSKYIPEFEKLYAWESRVPVEKVLTIRHLLTMTSGYNYNFGKENLKKVSQDKNATTLDVVKAMAKDYIEFFPGDIFCYGFGLDIVAAIVEVVSGMKFGEYVKKNIFEPLKMNNTTFEKDEKIIEKMLPQYRYNESEKSFNLVDKTNPFTLTDKFESGGAGLIGTINDYTKLVTVLANYGTSKDGYKLLSKESIDAMKTNHLTNEKLMEYFFKKDGGYGYGLGVRTLIDNSKTGAPLGEFGWDSAACAYSMIDVENNVGVFFGCHTLGWGKGYQHHNKIRDLVYECLEF